MENKTSPWVKASEILPEEKKNVLGKLNGRPAIIRNSNLHAKYITANGNLEPIEEVEWLDESLLTALSEEVKRLRETVIKRDLEIGDIGGKNMQLLYDNATLTAQLKEAQEKIEKMQDGINWSLQNMGSVFLYDELKRLL